jgi:hypothetical protein
VTQSLCSPGPRRQPRECGSSDSHTGPGDFVRKGVLMHRVTRHLRQNVVAYLALLFALSGTSYAAATKLLPANSVGTKQVINGSLLKKDFKPGQLLRGARGPQGLRGGPGRKACRAQPGRKACRGHGGRKARRGRPVFSRPPTSSKGVPVSHRMDPVRRRRLLILTTGATPERSPAAAIPDRVRVYPRRRSRAE